MRVWVSGAAGFIGFHVCRRLLSAGSGVTEVAGFDNLNDYYPVDLKRARLALLASLPGWTFEHGDLADASRVDAALAAFRPDAVLHLGAQAGVRYSVENPAAYVHSNISGFLSVLEASRRHGVRHLVFASSSSVYGANARIPFREDDTTDHPVSFYGATKKANEVMAHSHAHLHGLPCTGLRFFTVYGPWGRPDMSPMLFARAITEGRPIPVYHHGKASRDFTHVDDVVESIARLLALPPPTPDSSNGTAPFRIFNIGNGSPVALFEYIGILERHLGRKAILQLLPAQPGDMAQTYADSTALAAWTGFRPSTSLDAGLRGFAAWYRESAAHRW